MPNLRAPPNAASVCLETRFLLRIPDRLRYVAHQRSVNLLLPSCSYPRSSGELTLGRAQRVTCYDTFQIDGLASNTQRASPRIGSRPAVGCKHHTMSVRGLQQCAERLRPESLDLQTLGMAKRGVRRKTSEPALPAKVARNW